MTVPPEIRARTWKALCRQFGHVAVGILTLLATSAASQAEMALHFIDVGQGGGVCSNYGGIRISRSRR